MQIEVFHADTALQWVMLGHEGALLMFQARDSLAKEYPSLGDVPLAASANF